MFGIALYVKNVMTDQEDDPEYDMDAKNFPAHANKVAYIRRIPAWVSTAELGRQVGCLTVHVGCLAASCTVFVRSFACVALSHGKGDGLSRAAGNVASCLTLLFVVALN